MSTVKNIKKTVIAGVSALTLILGIAFAVNAMDKNEENKSVPTLVDQWFEYHGPNQTRAEIEKPSNYTLVSTPPTCSGDSELCSIYDTNNGSDKPTLSSGFVNQIMNAISSSTPTTAIKLEN